METHIGDFRTRIIIEKMEKELRSSLENSKQKQKQLLEFIQVNILLPFFR